MPDFFIKNENQNFNEKSIFLNATIIGIKLSKSK
jgi:hypothetical protein